MEGYKPGKTNKEERINFIRFWAAYVRNHSDKEWSKQQNFLINSILKSTKQSTREEYLKSKKKQLFS